MEVQVLDSRSKKAVAVLKSVLPTSTIAEVKELIRKERKLDVDRMEIRQEPKGKGVGDGKTLEAVGLTASGTLYLKDLGPQVGYRTVFIAEYFGPLVVYLLFYARPGLVYDAELCAKHPMSLAAQLGMFCWTGHYAKRLWETVFVHRFSHGTMPIQNLFRNCSYYWGFAGYVSYHVNHPLFTAPCLLQTYVALGIFILSELGNLSIHLALRDLRPPGTKERKIPKATGNPFTLLFNFVSCANYTYEFGSWLGFTVMTQCLPAGLFAVAGMYQMTVWALGKHRNYKKEFPNYPKGHTRCFYCDLVVMVGCEACFQRALCLSRSWTVTVLVLGLDGSGKTVITKRLAGGLI
ncbi:unnamed protein product [Notodromas monacha]|uniref:very-long-chain enoyl-CoA reductase n=1 Tax=Notodromas monacha TaxID=399045 RepID=A0A7R9BSS3_9CRUS|nr:unnamed protein product [Notodromas monacha]CAG0919686.1 unnamed protein product [Notodromas monacha]